MRLNVGSGSYAFRCLFEDFEAITGPTVVVGGHARGTPAILPVTRNDLLAPARRYHDWVAAGLTTLASQAGALAADVRTGNLGAARTAWLTAHLAYERLGAAYGTFGDFGDEINGLPDSPAACTTRTSPASTGWSTACGTASPPRQLTGVAEQARRRHRRAARPTSRRRRSTWSTCGLRAHEILENTLQFQLTGHADYGSGTTLATTGANIDGTRELLTILHPLLAPRYAGLPAVDSWLDRLQSLIGKERRPNGTWVSVSAAEHEPAPADRRGLQSGARGTGADRHAHRTAENVMPDPTDPGQPSP